jgi:hypothetical protein
MKTKALIIGGIAAVAVLAGGWALAQTTGHGPGGFGPGGFGPGGFGPGGMHGMRGQMGPGASGMHGPMGQGMFGGNMGPGRQGAAGPGVRGQMGPGQIGSGMMHHRGGDANFGIAGMGRGTMGMGHDPATRSQLGDIHALLINHDRIKRTVTNLPDGIRTVTESDDPQVAALIKTHVAEMGQRVKAGDDPGLPIESPALRAIFRSKDKIQTSYETTAAGVIVVQTSTDADTVAVLQKHAAEVTDLAQGGMAALHTAMLRNNGGIMGMMFGPMMHMGPSGNLPPNSR